MGQLYNRGRKGDDRIEIDVTPHNLKNGKLCGDKNMVESRQCR